MICRGEADDFQSRTGGERNPHRQHARADGDFAGAVLDEQTVQAFLRDRIAGYKVPATVEFVDTPLRDDAGKARRSAVRAQVMARRRLLDAG